MPSQRLGHLLVLDYAHLIPARESIVTVGAPPRAQHTNTHHTSTAPMSAQDQERRQREKGQTATRRTSNAFYRQIALERERQRERKNKRMSDELATRRGTLAPIPRRETKPDRYNNTARECKDTLARSEELEKKWGEGGMCAFRARRDGIHMSGRGACRNERAGIPQNAINKVQQ
jgi:hypothetical protein